MSVKEYGREKLQGLKGKVTSAIKAFALKWGAIIGGGIILIIILVSVISTVITSALGGNDEEGGTEDWESASESSWEQFTRYLRQTEGGGEIYKNSAGVDCYKVNPDGGGGSAVGYGVDIATHGGKLRKLGYQTTIGSLIPVSVVDPIEKKEKEARYNDVEKLSSDNGLNLTIFQKYALTSRTYNYGFAGGTGQATGSFIYPSTLTFVQAYKNYYKQSDTHYGDYTKMNLNHQLFTKYMTWLNYTDGTHPEGWETRRKSEWCLFQTGYFGWGLKNGGKYPEGFDEYCILSSGGTGSGNYDTSCARGYILGKFTSTKGRTYTVINQNKISGWGSNCNRAAAIIIASGYSKKSATQMVNIVMNREIWPEEQGGAGVAKYKDLGASLTVKDEIWSVKADNGTKVAKYVREATNVGGCVTLRFSSRTGPTENSKSSWAYSGHWITILDYRKKNGKEEMFVAESGHGNTGWYPINEFAGSTNIHYLSKIIPK